jgi:hypothetical protein
MSQLEDNRMQKITLKRTGDIPISFSGELIAEAASPPPDFQLARKDSRRWHELKLFAVAGSKCRYAIAIGFRTRLETETDQDTVIPCRTREEVELVLTGMECGELKSDLEPYDPLQFLEGFPDLPRFEDRQRNLENRVAADYRNRVSEILAEAGFTEQL